MKARRPCRFACGPFFKPPTQESFELFSPPTKRREHAPGMLQTGNMTNVLNSPTPVRLRSRPHPARLSSHSRPHPPGCPSSLTPDRHIHRALQPHSAQSSAGVCHERLLSVAIGQSTGVLHSNDFANINGGTAAATKPKTVVIASHCPHISRQGCPALEHHQSSGDTTPRAFPPPSPPWCHHRQSIGAI
jgi:hypothetical protein